MSSAVSGSVPAPMSRMAGKVEGVLDVQLELVVLVGGQAVDQVAAASPGSALCRARRPASRPRWASTGRSRMVSAGMRAPWVRNSCLQGLDAVEQSRFGAGRDRDRPRGDVQDIAFGASRRHRLQVAAGSRRRPARRRHGTLAPAAGSSGFAEWQASVRSRPGRRPAAAGRRNCVSWPAAIPSWMVPPASNVKASASAPYSKLRPVRRMEMAGAGRASGTHLLQIGGHVTTR